MKIVYATIDGGTATRDGLTVVLHAGDAWTADDPLVKERPDLFAAEPPAHVVRRTTSGPPVVEQATAGPGERRNLRRG